MGQFINTEHDGHVAVVTIDNPPMNALSEALLEELYAEIEALDTADEVPVRVVWKPVLTDAGGDHHRAQPPLGWLRGGRRNIDGVPGLRLNYPA